MGTERGRGRLVIGSRSDAAAVIEAIGRIEAMKPDKPDKKLTEKVDDAIEKGVKKYMNANSAAARL